tara:strand:- start:27749 stop:28522 length:774 start_codon:yes stop_codon:yes gene_type:complete
MSIRLLFTLFSLFVVGLIAFPVHADEYFDTKITPEEQAIFAFFRASGDAPDYDYWIESQRAYQELSESKQEDYLIKEMMRLGHGYGMYDQNTDLLEIKVNVLSRYVPAQDGKKAHITYRFLNLDKDATPSFNYRFGIGFISMVINRLDFFSDVELTPEKDRAIREKVPYEDDEFDATLQIRVRVSEADYDSVVENDGVKQWIMMGDIAYIKCEVDSYYTHQSYILWDYVAPWYEEAFRIQNMPEEQKYPHPYDLFKD